MQPALSHLSRLFPGVLGMIVLAAACTQETTEEPYAVATVTRRDIVVSASAAGMVEPIMTVEVKSKASGEIVEVAVEEGETVKAGQLLVRVDPRIPLNAVVQAEADSAVAVAELENAEAQLRRAETLWASQSITELEYESAKLGRASATARLISARRSLEDARIAFEDTEVRAASSGVILGRNVEVGSVIASASRDVSGGAVLMRMASLDTVQIRALVDETDIGMIQAGIPVTTTVEAYPNRPFRGEVLRIGAEAVVQQNVTMFPVLVRIANRQGLLRPGMNAEVEIHIGEVLDALAIPNAALRTPDELEPAAGMLGLSMEAVRMQLAGVAGDSVPRLPSDSAAGGSMRAGGSVSSQGTERPAAFRGQAEHGRDRESSLFGGSYVVFVLRNGTPRAVPIETGLTDFDYTVVVHGLSEGDSLVVLPTSGLIEELQRREEWARERAGGPLGNQGGPPR
ncbi:MAG: efflux RND transporter periplasmic adaptor subunit [Gemmatimonadota bacterium]|nr:efflux RND transporter periplasmic adaptor subunit [Gemmatimonadota bacterium]MDH4349870.1 efflux RND transporter periplasmic adaptor subunit [Gemmatimonadota bacterium]